MKFCECTRPSLLAIFKGKIAQLKALIKSPIFTLNISNFATVYFKDKAF